MEGSKEKREEAAVASYDEYGAENNSNMFQKPYDFIEEVVRAILRCLGFDDESAYQRCSCTVSPSESTAATTTTTTTTTAGATATDDDGAEKEETCPDEDEEELPPPSAAPEQGGDEGGDVGVGGGGEDGSGGDLSDPAVEPEPVLDGSHHQHPAGAAAEAIRRRPPRPGVSSGSDPQIH